MSRNTNFKKRKNCRRTTWQRNKDRPKRRYFHLTTRYRTPADGHDSQTLKFTCHSKSSDYRTGQDDKQNLHDLQIISVGKSSLKVQQQVIILRSNHNFAIPNIPAQIHHQIGSEAKERTVDWDSPLFCRINRWTVHLFCLLFFCLCLLRVSWKSRNMWHVLDNTVHWLQTQH